MNEWMNESNQVFFFALTAWFVLNDIYSTSFWIELSFMADKKLAFEI